ncbi:MAG: putative holin [Gammaproteobacteria bacterium]
MLAIDYLKDKFRMGNALVIAIALFAFIFMVADFQLPVLAWAMLKTLTGVYLGYWVDRWLFPADRPHLFSGPEQAWMRIKVQFRRLASIAIVVIGLNLTV